MRLRRLAYSILIFIVICILSSNVWAIEDEVDKSEIVKKAFSEWIETFKSEDVPENKRIIDYKTGTIGVREANENEIRASIEFIVIPVSEENTQWNYGEAETKMVDGHEWVVFQPSNICYVQLKNIDGEYQVEYIGETPEGYDEFAKRFEEYKKAHSQEEVENIQIQGEETDNQLANQEIEKMSNGIVIGCSVILIVVICLVGVKVIKNKSKNKFNK